MKTTPALVVILLLMGTLACGLMGTAGQNNAPDQRNVENPASKEARTLLFGNEEDISLVKEWLKMSDFCYYEVDAPMLPPEGNDYFLLALPNSDVDNLLLFGIDYILPDDGENEITELLNHVYPRV